MARVFITGSADGLGRMAGELLLQQGHQVILHARNESRANDLRQSVPNGEAIVIGDLSSIRQTRNVAEQVNALGACDAVIHNAGVGYREPRRIETEDGLSHLFAVNSLAPYIVTALISRPKRLVYVSSELHRRGDLSLNDLTWKDRRWVGNKAYSDTKLHNVLLACAVARHWPQVYSNSVEPGWVRTKMGGPSASDDLAQGPTTQAWLATSADPAAQVSGKHFYHLKQRDPLPKSKDPVLQDRFLELCASLSGVHLI